MKKILLVTWYKSTNCGTCLQSYALYSILSEKYDVYFLGKRTFYPLFSFTFYKKIYQTLKNIIKRKAYKKQLPHLYSESVLKQNIKYQNFIDNHYKFLTLKNYKDYKFITNNIDCYMIGSDQLWNPSMFSPAFMLDFAPNDKLKVSYAGSFGVDNICENIKPTYKRLLSRLDEISVREPKAKEIVKNLCGKDCKVVLDPTLLKTTEEWHEFSMQSNVDKEYNIPSKYIISYFIGSNEFDHFSTVKKIAEKLGYKIVVIPNKIEDYVESDSNTTIVYDVCNYDFVKLIENASLVCTDSFHSVIFSFLMNTSLFIFPRFKENSKNSQNSRLENIIATFKLEGHKWDENWIDSIERHMSHNYSESYYILDKLRKECKNYLLNLPNL